MKTQRLPQYLKRLHRHLIPRQSQCSSSTAQSTVKGPKPTASPKVIGSKLFIWGQMQGSSLGLGTKDQDSSSPIQLDDFDGSGYLDVSIGNTHCGVVTGNGNVFMFGTSHYGELGLNEEVSNIPFRSILGNNATVNVPTLIDPSKFGGKRIRSISCGGRHSAAIDEDGRLWTWGWGGNRLFACGGLGHGNKDSLNTPKMVEGLDGVEQVSCGEKHTLCINGKGEIFAFGEGEHGRLGTGHTSNCKVPTLLTFFGQIPMRKVVAAKEYSFGLTKEDGLMYGWGRNDRGQMGQGGGLAMDMYSCDTIPVAIGECADIVDIGLSQSDVLCVDSKGQCFYWGERVYLEPHQINEERFIEHQPAENGKVVAVEITAAMMCFVTENGELFTCNKTFGMKSDIFSLGHGSVQPFKEARPVRALEEQFVTKVVANDQRCIAITK